jgi:hypothetical protein
MADVRPRGVASWYGPGFYGNRTADGTVLTKDSLWVAHKTLPFGTKIRFTNPQNGKSIVLTVKDRGPFISGRDYDLTEKAAELIGLITGPRSGTGSLLTTEVAKNTRTGTVRQLDRPNLTALQERANAEEVANPPETTDTQNPTYVESGTSPNGQPLYIVTPPDGTPYSTNNLPPNAVRLEDSTSTSPGSTEPTITYNVDYSEFTFNELQDQFKFLEDQYTQLENQYQQREAENLDLTPEELEKLKKIKTYQAELLAEIRKRQDWAREDCPVASETTTSWSPEEKKCRDGYNYTALRALEAELEKQIQELPDPCGKSTLSGINNALLNFFETLKTIKKYYNVYVKGAVNRIQNITNLVARTSQIIASILKLLVQRMRNYIMNLLRKLIEKTIDRILNKLSKALKNTFIKAIIDAIICKFNEIIKGLSNLVVDFLYAMIGNVINAPICAVEQFTNALINNLSAKIDEAIQPIVSAINDVLGGVAKIAGKVFEAIDFILGFEAFLCAKPKCPQIKSWIPGTGVTPSAIEDFSNNFLPIPDAGQIEETILGGVDSAIGGLLPGVSIFGDERIEGSDLVSGNVPPGVQCFPGAFRCGPPKVEFFGGNGVGAVGNAVINSVGEVVGVDLSYGGRGYTAPPFVTFKDTCSDNSPSGSGGYGASGYTVINNDGEVVQVIMVNGGTRYLNTPSGFTEFGQPTEQLLPNEEVVTREYVTCLDEIQILDTGIGYSLTDSVSITPDVAGLQVKVQITEIGQIVAMEVLSSGCGFGEVPEITINSDTGAGLKVRPVMRFVNRDQYLQEQPDFNPTRLIKVIDCVLK